jgi:uracil-DNA glycosylase family 4
MADEELLRKFYTTLTLAEDYLTGGYRRRHAEPDFSGFFEKEAAAEHHKNPAEVPPPPASAPLTMKTASAAALAGHSTEELAVVIADCKNCALHSRRRQHALAGSGVGNPAVLVVGDTLSTDDEELGEPFRGAAGQFLDKWLESIGLSRKTNSYLTTLVKCGSGGENRISREWAESCLPFLVKQIEILKPKAILSCGRMTAQLLTDSDLALSGLRGVVYSFHNIPVIVTYSPDSVLKNTELKRPVWEDLKILRDLLGR